MDVYIKESPNDCVELVMRSYNGPISIKGNLLFGSNIKLIAIRMFEIISNYFFPAYIKTYIALVLVRTVECLMFCQMKAC